MIIDSIFVCFFLIEPNVVFYRYFLLISAQTTITKDLNRSKALEVPYQILTKKLQ